MRLIGYIKEIIENSFSIPIYSDKGKFYCHTLNEDFKIKSFYETIISQDYYVSNNTYRDFNINDFGALVFIGFDNTIFFESAEVIINRISIYINETTREDKYLLSKQEILDLKNKLLKSESEISAEAKNAFQEGLGYVAIDKPLEPGLIYSAYMRGKTRLSGSVGLDYLKAVPKISNIEIAQAVYIPANYATDYTLKYDISEITIDDVERCVSLVQRRKFSLISDKKKYILIQLILREYIEFHKIRYFSLMRRRFFLKYMSDEIAKNSQFVVGALVTYGAVTARGQKAYNSNPQINNPVRFGGKSKK